MRCQSCQSRPAMVHHTVIGDDKTVREVHLCEECYAQQKTAEVPGGPPLGALAASVLAGATPSGPSAARAAEEAAQACGQCGLTYAAFRTRGRLGCPECYETFRILLEPLLEKIHGSAVHVGKSPKDEGGRERAAERRLLALRRKLQEAVRAENYELCAKLRDQLRRAEAGEHVADEE